MSRARQYARAYRAPVQQRYRIGDIVVMNVNNYSNYLMCNGSILNISDYPDLYNILQGNYNLNFQPGAGYPWKNQYGINSSQTSDITGWTLTSSLPDNINENQVVVTKNRVYSIGGRNATGVVNTIYTAPINSDGTLGAWALYGTTPSSYSFRQAVVVNNYLYLIGGYNDSIVATSETLYTTINPDGTLGSWSTAAPIPLPIARSKAFLTKGKIYIVGGNSLSGSCINAVYIANLNSSGFITSWSLGKPFAKQIYRGSLAVTSRYVYMLGGLIDAGNNNINSVYRAYINSDGSISDWVLDANLPSGLSRSESVVVNNKVYLIGGTDINNNQSSTVYINSLNSDGTLGPWVTGTSFPTTISQHQLIVTSSKIYNIGGIINGQANNSIYSANFSGGLNDYSPYYSGLYQDPNVSGSQFRLPDLSKLKTPPGTSYYIKCK